MTIMRIFKQDNLSVLPGAFMKPVSTPEIILIYSMWHIQYQKASKYKQSKRRQNDNWIKGVHCHLYCCATSTKAGFLALKVAK